MKENHKENSFFFCSFRKNISSIFCVFVPRDPIIFQREYQYRIRQSAIRGNGQSKIFESIVSIAESMYPILLALTFAIYSCLVAEMGLICANCSSSWIFLSARHHANSSWNEGFKIRWQNCDATLNVFLLTHQLADATIHISQKQSILHFIRLVARFR